ncbi:hypothetical protein FSP39_006769 [Pinctada imbricata]|uniref:Uncharacterized protein n=1 Tax=Pinctada imbricata TaxID=66713 RepID=A0AA88YHK9_PINIB|nr:hypothetical protein FSP39_006769 [Pinctada imbricata]
MESCTFSSRQQNLCEPLYIDTDINYNLDLSLFPGIEDPVKRFQPQLLIHGPQTCDCFRQYYRLPTATSAFYVTQPADFCCCQDCSLRDNAPSSYHTPSTRQQTTCYEFSNQCIDLRNEQVVPSSFPENVRDLRFQEANDDKPDQFLLSPWELSFLIDDVTKDNSGTDQDLDMYLCSGKRKSTSDQDEVPSKRVRIDECSDSPFYNSPRYYSSGLEMIRGV